MGDVLGWRVVGVCGGVGGVGTKSAGVHAEASDWDQTKWRQPGKIFLSRRGLSPLAFFPVSLCDILSFRPCFPSSLALFLFLRSLFSPSLVSVLFGSFIWVSDTSCPW